MKFLFITLLLAILMFFVTGCDKDPVFPLIEVTVANPADASHLTTSDFDTQLLKLSHYRPSNIERQGDFVYRTTTVRIYYIFQKNGITVDQIELLCRHEYYTLTKVGQLMTVTGTDITCTNPVLGSVKLASLMFSGTINEDLNNFELDNPIVDIGYE